MEIYLRKASNARMIKYINSDANPVNLNDSHYTKLDVDLIVPQNMYGK